MAASRMVVNENGLNGTATSNDNPAGFCGIAHINTPGLWIVYSLQKYLTARAVGVNKNADRLKIFFQAEKVVS
jgi:hypothetical protein